MRRVVAIVLATATLAALLAWLLSSPEARLPAPSEPSAPSATAPLAPTSAREATPTGAPVTPEITTVAGDESFRLHVFTIPLQGARFRVIDLGMSRDLATTRARTEASLVINGGFFDKEEAPEGLVISEGTTISPRSDTLGGGVIAVTAERASLSPAEGYTPPPDVRFAVQARPRLVVSGKSTIVKDDGRAAPRTALCVRDAGRTLEAVIARGDAGAGPTLSLLADMLVSRGCEAALNLDGGPSTGAAFRDGEGTHDLPPRGPLRHAIAIWLPPP
ncbi:Hypothetical protein A7982_11803 [Minicystis rosea]|nr:Hypothetical protein A7982_11803 [Minicystis rosea]